MIRGLDLSTSGSSRPDDAPSGAQKTSTVSTASASSSVFIVAESTQAKDTELDEKTRKRLKHREYVKKSYQKKIVRWLCLLLTRKRQGGLTWRSLRCNG